METSFRCIKKGAKKLHNGNVFSHTKSKAKTHFCCVIFLHPLFIQRDPLGVFSQKVNYKIKLSFLLELILRTTHYLFF